jgi:hypothetical protein
MEGLKTHDIELIGSSFANDIRFVTPAKIMKKDQIFDFLSALYRGFPNWTYDHDEPLLFDDGTIGVNWRQGGTHTGPVGPI